MSFISVIWSMLTLALLKLLQIYMNFIHIPMLSFSKSGPSFVPVLDTITKTCKLLVVTNIMF